MRRSGRLIWFGLNYLRRLAEQGLSPYEMFDGYGLHNSGVGMQGFLGPLHSYPSSNSHLVRPPRWPVSPPPRGLNLRGLCMPPWFCITARAGVVLAFPRVLTHGKFT